MKPHRYFISCISSFLFCSTTWGTSTDWSSVQKSIEEKMKLSQISALQMSYVESDGTQHDFNLGTTELNGGSAVNDETRFYSASLTKMFTAISLFQLREQGLLRFEDKIVKHFKFLSSSRDSRMKVVTIRQILSHSSGMARNGELFWTDADLISKGISPSERDVFSAALTQKFGVNPGTQLKYSNLGYELLGLLVGKLCTDCKGTSLTARYKNYVYKHILLPLRMTKSGFDLDQNLMKTFATPYMPPNNQGLRNSFAMIRTAGASVGAWGLFSTSKDMMKFIRELGKIISNEKNVLVSKRIASEIQNAVLIDSLNSSFGHSIGFRLIKVIDPNQKTGFLVGHTGTFPGYSSAAFYNTLDRSSGVVYFNVVDGGGLGYLMLATTPNSGIKQVPGTSNFNEQSPTPARPTNPFAGIVKKWEFIYGAMEITFENDRYYFVQSGQKIPLYLQPSESHNAIVGYLGTNSGYLDFIGDSIAFALDKSGDAESAIVANSIHLLPKKN